MSGSPEDPTEAKPKLKPKRPQAGSHLAQVPVESRAGLRSWLQAHHGQKESVWLVLWKKGEAGHIGYDAVVEEALCFGWIDSLPRRYDDRRSLLLLSPRKPGSNWSKLNRERVARLEAAGLMTPAGAALVAAAKADGRWSALDAVERLEEPADLTRALDADPEARRHWNGFSPSSRRGILEWIGTAKGADTRARRIAETARLAARNLRANSPEARSAPPNS